MTSLLNFDIAELSEILKLLGEPSFRAKQIFKWLHSGADFSEMTNIPKTVIAKLQEEYVALGIEILQKLVSKDGTVKYLYKLQDGNIVEGVLMQYKYGNTLCVSTQAGCRMNCTFCASGIDGLIRNLTPSEILGQVVVANRDNGGDLKQRAVTNVVLMGSGEPLDNYDNVAKFLGLINNENGLNISERNISLSTSGLADKIYKLADDGFHITLTISLHAPNDEIRSSLMPVNKKYSISELLRACRYYFEKTGRRYIFEYALIDGKNDSLDNARELAVLLRGLPCHINLIRLNYVKERGLKASDNAVDFLEVLLNQNLSATIRRTMGSDIEGACGQLRRRYIQND
ncbi:MAG: 23S rRNA (adenine(2503)-C(2))-methyltransferase RlmN [Clostridia bacterium]